MTRSIRCIVGTVVGTVCGFFCILLLTSISWGIEVNETWMSIASIAPAAITGFVVGVKGDESDSVWQVFVAPLIAAAITAILGLIVSAAVGIYLLFSSATEIDGLILALIVGLLLPGPLFVIGIFFRD